MFFPNADVSCLADDRWLTIYLSLSPHALCMAKTLPSKVYLIDTIQSVSSGHSALKSITKSQSLSLLSKQLMRR